MALCGTGTRCLRFSVAVRRTRLDILVLLTLALARESPTCIFHQGIHNPSHARSKYHTQLAKLSCDQETFSVDLTAEVYFCIFFNIHTTTSLLFEVNYLIINWYTTLFRVPRYLPLQLLLLWLICVWSVPYLAKRSNRPTGRRRYCCPAPAQSRITFLLLPFSL